MKAAALASGGLAVGLSSTGTIAAQDDGDALRGLMFSGRFFPEAQFEIVSGPLEWVPVAADQAETEFLFDDPDLFADFETRVVQYQFAPSSHALLMVPGGTNVQEGQVYRLSLGFDAFDTADFEDYGIDPGFEADGIDEGFNELGLVSIQFSPAGNGTQTETETETTTPEDGDRTETETTTPGE